jgi:hypothetical protein
LIHVKIRPGRRFGRPATATRSTMKAAGIMLPKVHSVALRASILEAMS